MTLIETYKLACKLHANQSDKAGSPYIEHLTRVMLLTQAAGGDTEQQIAALLHDSIEDGHADADSLREAGVPEGAIVLIVALTRKPRQAYDDYIGQVGRTPKAVLVKRADLRDNLSPERLAKLYDEDRKRLSAKYNSALLALTGVQQ